MRKLTPDDIRTRLAGLQDLARRARPGAERRHDVDLEAEGLLEGAEEGEAQQARIDLLEQLLDAGCTVDELRAAVAEDRLTLLPVERTLSGDSKYTLEEVAERSGLDAETLVRHMSALGIGRAPDGERGFDDDDVDAATLVREFLEAGLPEEGLVEVARVLGQGMSRLAEAMRSMVGETFLQAGDTERDLGLRYAEAAEKLAPMMEPLLTYVLRLHLLDLVRNDVVDRAARDSGRFAGASEVTVCFADLVGFTRLGEELPADELQRVAGRLMELALDESGGPVKVIKSIGDAVMLASSNTSALVETAIRLVDRAGEEGERFPQLRAGVARGQAVHRGGDWYGRPVNLASRLTEIARPGSVLTTNTVREVLGDDGGFEWSKAGRRQIKGIDRPLGLVRVRRADEDADD